MAVSHTIKYLPTTWPKNCILRCSPRSNEGIRPQKELFKNSLATLSIIAENSFLNRRVYWLCYIHTNQYYTIIKRNRPLMHKTKWKNLTELIERRQTKKRRGNKNHHILSQILSKSFLCGYKTTNTYLVSWETLSTS